MAKKRKSTRGSRRPEPSYWVRYDYKRTKNSGGERRYKEWVGSNFANLTVSAPCTDRDVIEQIARNATKPMPIDLLSPCLSERIHPRSSTYFDTPDQCFTQIAQNYPQMYWWISQKGLRMEVVSASTTSIRTFDQVAGKLMFEARSSQPTRRISTAAYKVIADQLRDFTPLVVLSKSARQELGEWNKKNQARAIHTFSAAIEARQPRTLRREVRRVLYRAESKYRLTPAPQIVYA